jgi:Neurotransmitter-gated ion-channel ligand binding domain
MMRIQGERQEATTERRAPASTCPIVGSVPRKFMYAALMIVVALIGSKIAIAQSVDGFSRTVAPDSFVLGPPTGDGPVGVQASFDLHDINLINDEDQIFEFTGIVVLKWRDPRQAFDPVQAGVEEKVFQGNYQFNELSPGWFPQVVLVNEAEPLELSGVVLRLKPDGTSTLTMMLNAAAKVDLDLRRFPFDRHRVEMIFEVLGFDASEVVMQVAAGHATLSTGHIRVPQWSVEGSTLSTRERQVSSAGLRGVASSLILSVEVDRQSWYVRRLIVAPLVLIVLLSFSVFWMDRSSLGDRNSVSFIGILTAVAYQTVMSDNLPRIAYVTLMHGFLNLSFMTMCATVVINLVVGALDRNGMQSAGDRLDRRCRWIFPIAYFGLLWLIIAVAFTLFE